MSYARIIIIKNELFLVIRIIIKYIDGYIYTNCLIYLIYNYIIFKKKIVFPWPGNSFDLNAIEVQN